MQYFPACVVAQYFESVAYPHILYCVFNLTLKLYLKLQNVSNLPVSTSSGRELIILMLITIGYLKTMCSIKVSAEISALQLYFIRI